MDSRSRNGGMKWRRAMSTPRRSSAVPAARRHKHDARRRDAFTLKGLPVRRPRTEEIRNDWQIGFFHCVDFFVYAGTALHGADVDGLQRQLIEGARKEGSWQFYTSVETEFARSLTTAFEAKYLFIKTDICSTHEKILSRMNVERKTGTYTADNRQRGGIRNLSHAKKRVYHAPQVAVCRLTIRRIQGSQWLLDRSLHTDRYRLQHETGEAGRAANADTRTFFIPVGRVGWC